MFCLIIADKDQQVVQVYGPYTNTNECMKQLSSMEKAIPLDHKWRIWPMFK